MAIGGANASVSDPPMMILYNRQVIKEGRDTRLSPHLGGDFAGIGYV